MQTHPSITAITANATTVVLFGVITFLAIAISVSLIVRERRTRAGQEDNA